MTEKIKQLELDFADYRKIEAWRSNLEFVSSYLFIIFLIYLTIQISFWFYPIVVILIGSRQHALALLGHEAVHGTLYKNPKLNTFIGKYFGHYPLFISHHRYKIQHLLHHRFLGQKQDPDLEFYYDYPKEKAPALRNLLWISLSGRIILFFLEYYNGFRLPFLPARKFRVNGAGDNKQLIIFWIIVFGILSYFKILTLFFLFWVVPFICFLPWILFKVTLEHAPVKINNSALGNSRTIISNKFVEWLLFPVHINFHSEHHLFPWVPHYRLRAVSRKLAALEKNPEFSFLNLRQMNFVTGSKQLWKT